MQNKASLPVIKRLPKYYRYLSNLQADGRDKISSSELARMMGTTASQVRQDFNCFGGFGQQGIGYKADVLLIAAFDINPALEGKEISGVTIRPLSELESFCAAHKPVVAVLCVPRQSAMDLSDELVRLGIQGFWNFSHYDLSVVYPQVTVENVHLGDSLMSLGYRLRSHDE